MVGVIGGNNVFVTTETKRPVAFPDGYDQVIPAGRKGNPVDLDPLAVRLKSRLDEVSYLCFVAVDAIN